MQIIKISIYRFFYVYDVFQQTDFIEPAQNSVQQHYYHLY